MAETRSEMDRRMVRRAMVGIDVPEINGEDGYSAYLLADLGSKVGGGYIGAVVELAAVAGGVTVTYFRTQGEMSEFWTGVNEAHGV